MKVSENKFYRKKFNNSYWPSCLVLLNAEVCIEVCRVAVTKGTKLTNELPGICLKK